MKKILKKIRRKWWRVLRVIAGFLWRFDPDHYGLRNGKVYCLYHEEEVHRVKYDNALAIALGEEWGWQGCKYCGMDCEPPETPLPEGYNSEFLN